MLQPGASLKLGRRVRLGNERGTGGRTQLADEDACALFGRRSDFLDRFENLDPCFDFGALS